MIRKNALNFKLILSNHSSKSRFDVFMKQFCPELERCPYCNAEGMCRIFARYKRHIVDYCEGKIVSHILVITRVICACGRTHAILPDFIIPYRQYSLPFILHVLRAYLTHACTLDNILESFGISHQLLGHWMSAYRKHKDLWLGRLRSSETSPLEFLNDLLDTVPFSGFTMGFYSRTLYSFLQLHGNPSNCCLRPTGLLS